MILTGLVLFGFFKGASATDAPPEVAAPTIVAAGKSTGGKKRKVLIGDRLYEVDSLKDVEFLLKRIVRTQEPVLKPAGPRKVVTERISTKAEPAEPVAVPMPFVAPDWSGLYQQLAEQDAAYARALVRAMEAIEEDDIETLLLAL